MMTEAPWIAELAQEEATAPRLLPGRERGNMTRSGVNGRSQPVDTQASCQHRSGNVDNRENRMLE